MRGICLCSGGLDSSLALVKLLKSGHQVVPMFVDYRQWPVARERDAFQDVLYSIGLRSDLGNQLLPGEEGLLGWKGMSKIGSVWGRGIALAGLAAMWAYTNGNSYDFIALGNHKGDVGPDCKPGEFDSKLNGVLTEATKGTISLLLPIADLDIEGIGRGLHEVGIPFDIMYSCYWDPPCGYRSEKDSYLCPGCRRKLIAMQCAGIETKGIGPNCRVRTYQSALATKVDY